MNALNVWTGAACLVLVLTVPSALLAKPRPPSPPPPQSASPLYVLDFDEPYWNGATAADLSDLGYPDFVEGFSGYGLRRYANPAMPFFLPAVDASGHTNVAPATGSLIFMFRPYWSSSASGGTGPGAPARLIEFLDIRQWPTLASLGAQR